MLDALHPQTLLAYGMNGRDLPVAHGAPLRLRVERQIGYKSMKYLRRIVVTDAVRRRRRSGLPEERLGVVHRDLTPCPVPAVMLAAVHEKRPSDTDGLLTASLVAGGGFEPPTFGL